MANVTTARVRDGARSMLLRLDDVFLAILMAEGSLLALGALLR